MLIKLNVVIFPSPNKSLDKVINMKTCKELAKQAKYVKFLSLLLDENLTWKVRCWGGGGRLHVFLYIKKKTATVLQ